MEGSMTTFLKRLLALVLVLCFLFDPHVAAGVTQSPVRLDRCATFTSQALAARESFALREIQSRLQATHHWITVKARALASAARSQPGLSTGISIVFLQAASILLWQSGLHQLALAVSGAG